MIPRNCIDVDEDTWEVAGGVSKLYESCVSVSSPTRGGFSQQSFGQPEQENGSDSFDGIKCADTGEASLRKSTPC